MDMIFRKTYTIADNCTDRYDRLRPSQLLFYAQDAATSHCAALGMDWNTMAEKGMFWAVTRTKVQVERLPSRGETVTVETWPMPTTRVAYPRAMAMYSESGELLLRTLSLWVLMDMEKRTMILPGKSGITLEGVTRGNELTPPAGVMPCQPERITHRTVAYSDLDVNGHLNNARYMDWVNDLVDSAFHKAHSPREFTVCYLTEAREGRELELGWHYDPETNMAQAEFRRVSEADPEKMERVFAAKLVY